MPKMVCVQCEVEYKVVTNDAFVIEYFSNPPQPYKIWSADAWECPVCHHKIMAGFAYNALAEHYEERFEVLLERLLTGDLKEGTWVINEYELKHRPVQSPELLEENGSSDTIIDYWFARIPSGELEIVAQGTSSYIELQRKVDELQKRIAEVEFELEAYNPNSELLHSG